MGEFILCECDLAAEGNTMSAIYRCAADPNAPVLDIPMDTLYDIFQSGCRFGRTRPLFGRRKRDADGRLLDEFEWWTYGEVELMAQLLGSALLRLGLLEYVDFPTEVYPPARRLRPVAICSKNRVEWFVTDLAASFYKSTVIPLYDTLGDEALEYMLTTSRVSCVAGAAENLENLLRVLTRCSTHCVKSLVCFDPISEIIRSRAAELSVTVYAYEDLFEHARQEGILPLDLPTREDVASVCFTSGTMDRPKGVILTHAAFGDLMKAHVQGPLFNKGANMHTDHCYISYLPLAHVLEKEVFNVMLLHGARVPIYSGDPARLLEDIKICKPTIFASVPRILTRIDDKIAASVSSNSLTAQYLFRTGLDAKLKALRMQGRFSHPFWDPLIFNKVKALLGGQLEYIVFGGALLDKCVQERLACMFGCPVLCGFGLSETSGGCVGSWANDGVCGHSGGPLPGIELRLVSAKEMGYQVENDPPAGELWLRGSNVMPNYFLDPERTAETLTADGWLKTGDIATRLPEGGRIKIIDRKKNIFKLSQGEYIAPERVESTLTRAALVGQAFVYGDSTKNFLVAILCLDEEEVTAVLRRAAIAGTEDLSIEEKMKHPFIRSEVEKQIAEKTTAAQLCGFERVKAFYVETEPFSPANGLITPTLKLIRTALVKKYLPILQDMYSNSTSLNA